MLCTGNQPSDLSSHWLAITEHALLPMATVEGTSHVVRHVNPAFCRLIDGEKEQLVGKEFSELLPEKDIYVTLLDRVFRTGNPENHTEQEYSNSHPIFWSCSMWPIMANDRPVGVVIQVTETAQFHEKTLAMNEALILGSVRQHELTATAYHLNTQLHEEITERKKMGDELRKVHAQLADHAGQLEQSVTERTMELTAANKQLEAMVYSIAHDLRAPLRSMQGFSVLLIRESDLIGGEGRGYADRINKSAQFMDAMVKDILAFSRICQQRIESASVSLKIVVDLVLADLKENIRESNGRIESPGPWPVVLAHQICRPGSAAAGAAANGRPGRVHSRLGGRQWLRHRTRLSGPDLPAIHPPRGRQASGHRRRLGHCAEGNRTDGRTGWCGLRPGSW